MAYWWQRYTDTPDGNTSPPPDGAPENHFPDQVNNIQRQAMSAIAEIGEKVLGLGDGTPPPQTAVTISGAFLKLNYDAILPINTIMAWDSNQGVNAFPTPDFPEFSGVVWEVCDATGTVGTPNFQDVSVIGSHSAVGPDQTFTGDTVPGEQTGLGGQFDTPAGVTGAHTLVEAEIPAHTHDASALDMNTTGSHTHNNAAKLNQSPGQGAAQSTGLVQTDSSSAGDHKHTISGATGSFGADGSHTHDLDALAIPDHTHTTGTPPGTVLELYKRTA